jgi:predicted ester cyclase
VIAEGDGVAARWITRATHRGEFMGIPPTGNRVEIMSMGVFRFSNGRIVESWDNYDTLVLMRQLGVSPIPGQIED